MEEMLSKIADIGINVDTQSLVEVARYWFIADIIETFVIGGIIVGVIILGYKLIKKDIGKI